MHILCTLINHSRAFTILNQLSFSIKIEHKFFINLLKRTQIKVVHFVNTALKCCTTLLPENLATELVSLSCSINSINDHMIESM